MSQRLPILCAHVRIIDSPEMNNRRRMDLRRNRLAPHARQPVAQVLQARAEAGGDGRVSTAIVGAAERVAGRFAGVRDLCGSFGNRIIRPERFRPTHKPFHGMAGKGSAARRGDPSGGGSTVEKVQVAPFGSNNLT